MALQYAIWQLDSFGIVEILVFMLIFVLFFAILQKVKIFGDPNAQGNGKVKTYNAVVALVVGALVIIPHVLYGDLTHVDPYLSNGWPDVVNIIAHALPNVSIVVVAVLMALILIGLLGKRFEIGEGSISGWIAMAAFAVILFIFGSAAGWWDMPVWLSVLNNPDLMALVVVILVFAILIWFITKEDKKPGTESFGDKFSKLLKSP